MNKKTYFWGVVSTRMWIRILRPRTGLFDETPHGLRSYIGLVYQSQKLFRYRHLVWLLSEVEQETCNFFIQKNNSVTN